MSDVKKGSQWRNSVSFAVLVIFLFSFFMAQSALALNAGSGSKSCNFQGYRYLDNNSVQIWIDKNMPLPELNQFKIFEGTEITPGRELSLAGLTQGSGNSCSYPGLSNGGSVILQSYESFEPGKTYTVVINSTVKGNSGMPLGQNSAHQDVVFTFSAPNVAGSPNNASGEYAASIVPIISYKPAMNAVNVAHEGTIWFALNVPVKDVETANSVKNNLVLKKDETPVITDDTIDVERKENAEIYSPIFSDDLTFFYFPMTGGGAAYSFNLDYNQTYTLDIPAIETINGKTIPAQTLTFKSATDVVPTLISGVLTAIPTGNNLTITWPSSTEIADVSPAASGYNVWASENPYWDFTRLNTSPVPATSTSYVTSGLAPGKTYNFRVSGVNGSAEGGFSDFVQAVTPAATVDTQCPEWYDGNLSATAVKSTSLTLTWTPATDDVLVTNYRIYEEESLLATVDGSTYSKQISGLTPDTAYSFKVEAGDAQGNWSADGPETSVRTKPSSGGGGSDEDTEPPTWPNSNFIEAKKSGEEVTLTWYPAEDNVAVTCYRIYRGSELIEEVDGDITTFTYNAPTGTGQQTYSVQAGDEAGNWSTDGPTKTLGGKNLPLIKEYGLYNYDPDSNTTLPSSIGSVETASPWTLTNVPCVFEDDIAIGIKFATNVAVETHFSDNQAEFKMLDASNNSIDIFVDRAGDGTNTDINRDYLFVIPQETLQSGSQYKITIGPNLTSNNGMSAGVRQEVTFTTAKGGSGSTDDEDILTEGPTITSGSADVDPAVGAIVGLGSDAVVVIPVDALQGNSEVEVKVEKVISPPEAPANAHFVSDVYEFTVGGKTSYSFSKNVELRLKFDSSAIGTDEIPSIFYCDFQNNWISMGGKVSGSTITAQVDHFTKYTVFAVKKPLSLNDISGHWAQSNIEKLVASGTVSGYPDGGFKPGNPITRAEFATILVKAFNLTDGNGKVFVDTARHWAKDYIAKAAASGIVNGYDADTFGPDDLITREQMAVMIVRAAKLSPSAGDANFADSGSISDWAEEFIATAVRNGLIKGYPDNTFMPQGSATRAEAVTVIVNALKYK